MDTFEGHFEGRGAVITGGASGIGFATARELARRGASVVLADIERPALDQAVRRLRDEGLDAHGVVCDVRHLDEVGRLADEAFRTLGRVHVVFNNAGIAVSGPITRMTHDDWRWVIDVDLWGPIHGVEIFLPRLLEQDEGGHMLFTSSFAGLVANVGLAPYSVAKFGVVALAEALAREVKAAGIGVSVLCPMLVATNIGDSERNRGADYGGPSMRVVATPGGSGQNAAPENGVLDVDAVAGLTVEAILANRLYILPHQASRGSIRRRFERIDRTFDDQAVGGWVY
ncbi:MAG: SDR family NAD(P)-dependent oxidoreductase [Mycobacterium sp.]|nr:SDR family NAD(P)-dependent oxidoreductase [Mycobacterium sp.]